MIIDCYEKEVKECRYCNIPPVYIGHDRWGYYSCPICARQSYYAIDSDDRVEFNINHDTKTGGFEVYTSIPNAKEIAAYFWNHGFINNFKCTKEENNSDIELY